MVESKSPIYDSESTEAVSGFTSMRPRDVMQQVYQLLDTDLELPTQGISLTTKTDVQATLSTYQSSGELPEQSKVARNTLAVPLIKELMDTLETKLSGKKVIGDEEVTMEEFLRSEMNKPKPREDSSQEKELTPTEKFAALQNAVWEEVSAATAGWLNGLKESIASKNGEGLTDAEKALLQLHQRFVSDPNIQRQFLKLKLSIQRKDASRQTLSALEQEILGLDELPLDIQKMPTQLMNLYSGMHTAHAVLWKIMEPAFADRNLSSDDVSMIAKNNWELAEKLAATHLVVIEAISYLYLKYQSEGRALFIPDEHKHNLVFQTPVLRRKLLRW